MMKILAFSMSLVMLVTAFGVLPFSAAAEEIRSGSCGDGLTYTISEATDCLTIKKSDEGTGKMTDFAYQKSPFWKAPFFYKVYMLDGVKTVGTFAFYQRPSIKEVYFPDTLVSINKDAFSCCYGITELNCPANLTTIGTNAFQNCTGLKTVKLNNKLKTIGEYAFQNDEAIEAVTMGTGLQTLGKYAFANCSSLTEITVPASVKTIGDAAFTQCKSLTVVNITDLKAWCNIKMDGFTSNPLYYARMLKLNGKPISALNIPSGVTRIENYRFRCAENITSATLPNTVTSIGESAFSECEAMTSIFIPKSVTKIERYAFSLTGLKDVYYGGSKSDWEKIDVDLALNAGLKDSTIHYNSSAPASSGTGAVVKPAKVAITKVKKDKKSFTVKWKKVSGAAGYQVQYSLKKKMKKATIKTVNGGNKTSFTAKKLKKKKTYYVRVRAYKIVNGKKLPGHWSGIKKIKTK